MKNVLHARSVLVLYLQSAQTHTTQQSFVDILSGTQAKMSNITNISSHFAAYSPDCYFTWLYLTLFHKLRPVKLQLI